MNTEQRMSPCMGGWCVRRTSCAHYVAPTDSVEPAERLCKRGEPDHYAPLAYTWARQGVPA